MNKILILILLFVVLVETKAQTDDLLNSTIKITSMTEAFKKSPGPFQSIQINDTINLSIDSTGYLVLNKSILLGDWLADKFSIKKNERNKVIEYLAVSEKAELMSAFSTQNFYSNEYKFIVNANGSGKCMCVFPENKEVLVFKWIKLK